jgi:hypothetical protein
VKRAGSVAAEREERRRCDGCLIVEEEKRKFEGEGVLK